MIPSRDDGRSVKAYEGVITVRVISYGVDAKDAANNAGTLLDWATGSSVGWAINTDTGHWPVSSWTEWDAVGGFRRSPEHDKKDWR
jgi:hypothetical protein